MHKIKLLICSVFMVFASSASAWTTSPAGVVENCTWQYVNTYKGIGVYIVEYRSVGSCRYNTKLYDYRVREIRYY
ncbi:MULTISPECIES: hypothetical protein [Pseudoalteromonas]|uniref:Uncharacterized protein n=1 Tax=Pseudoalteromonas obscura TaxID=3048491 RepID=A0ABT7EM08_9GAMM|nr:MULTISPECIES: hypothetical protein [Pseudoalteromonas]MBQ4837969.1 hypothetical protein [Pseudoalteromonas luteoviolacea]MDK2596085.1 hypothetical protein [Pseudoalteromonas sp. P94(2023)]